jgi:hypothetical protein
MVAANDQQVAAANAEDGRKTIFVVGLVRRHVALVGDEADAGEQGMVGIGECSCCSLPQ